MAQSPNRPPSPAAARAQAKREERLAEIAEQIDSGELVVRQMTKAERDELERRRSARGKPAGRRPTGR